MVAGGGRDHQATHCDAVKRATVDSKAYNPPRVQVHDHHHPVRGQVERLVAKQVDRPQTVFAMAEEGQPRRATIIGARLVMLHQHAAGLSGPADRGESA